MFTGLSKCAVALDVSLSALIGENRQESRCARELVATLDVPDALELQHHFFSLAPEQRNAVRILTLSLAVEPTSRERSEVAPVVRSAWRPG